LPEPAAGSPLDAPPPADTAAGTARAWLWALLWTAFVLGFGGEGSSEQATSRFIGPLLRWLLPDASAATLYDIHYVIRKAAHVGEYGLLALLALRALRPRGGAARALATAGALLWVGAVAALDESRQAFAATRTGSLQDVALDLAGGVLALLGRIAYTRVMHDRRGSRKRA
jgi:VanZ family protein